MLHCFLYKTSATRAATHSPPLATDRPTFVRYQVP